MLTKLNSIRKMTDGGRRLHKQINCSGRDILPFFIDNDIDERHKEIYLFQNVIYI